MQHVEKLLLAKTTFCCFRLLQERADKCQKDDTILMSPENRDLEKAAVYNKPLVYAPLRQLPNEIMCSSALGTQGHHVTLVTM